MKIISFCLWGNNPKYNIGAQKNIELAKRYYPGWLCRFYCDNTISKTTEKTIIESSNCQMVKVKDIGNWKFTVNRFLPMSEEIEYMISRDTDSRIGDREASAVSEWIESGKSAHIMRDHPYHGGFPMLAGMFGIKGGVIKNIKALLDLYQNTEQYHYDQFFLKDFIYPFIEDDVIIHDEFFEKKAFPKKRNGLDFVGQIFDENEQIVQEHSTILEKAIEHQNSLRREIIK